jgi:hypothetical protein
MESREGAIVTLSIVGDILGGVLAPHVVAFLLLLRFSMIAIRPNRDAGARAAFAGLWAWSTARWRVMIVHPLYWAATGIVSAYFLIDPLRRMFL